MIGEIIIEGLLTGIFESLPKFIGTFIRWCFYLGRKSFETVFKEEYNRRVGFLTIAIIIGVIIALNN